MTVESKDITAESLHEYATAIDPPPFPYDVLHDALSGVIADDIATLNVPLDRATVLWTVCAFMSLIDDGIDHVLAAAAFITTCDRVLP